MSETTRTPVREKAKQFAKLLHKENPDYTYIRELFRHLRRELGISAVPGNKRLPYVPTEEEVQKSPPKKPVIKKLTKVTK